MDNVAVAEHLEYVVSAKEVIWGIVLIAITMIMHAFGMVTTLQVSQRLRDRMPQRSGFLGGVRLLVLASWMIVLTHLLEVMVWAGFFTWRGALPSISAANYYALLQYTTVGSNVSLPFEWRLLGGMLPMAGMLTFAWSTTVLLGLALHVQEVELRRRAHRPAADKSGNAARDGD